MPKIARKMVGGEEGTTARDMARAKHILYHNREEAARGRKVRAEKMKFNVILDVGGDRYLSSKKTLLRCLILRCFLTEISGLLDIPTPG